MRSKTLDCKSIGSFHLAVVQYSLHRDGFSFAKLGVPMLYGESGQDLVAGGSVAGAAAAADYTEHRYHKPQDEYDPNWNWDGAIQDLTIYFQMGRMLANSTRWPNWYPNAEFRAVRDKDRASVAAQ